jgi:hypothetical protein
VSGYSQTPLWKKLGVRAGDQLVLLDPPSGWRVPELPAPLSVRTETGARGRAHADVLLAFATKRAQLKRLGALSRRIYPDGAVWVAWPRRAGGHQSDIREQDVRDAALPLGLVDVKVAAIDEDWSGLRLVWRRERRGA